MVEAAEAAGMKNIEFVPIEIPAGSCVIHHGRTWHGSRDNSGNSPRRAVIAHCISSAATFHPTAISYIYSRYKKVGSVEMDESYFPVLWRDDDYRTPWIHDHVAGKIAIQA